MFRSLLVFLCNLTVLLSNAQGIQSIDFLIKDTAIVRSVKEGNYHHPAIEIASKTEFKTITHDRSFPVKIAIDPGHIANNKKEAIIEDRFINSPHGFFYEGELTMATSMVLKNKLEERGYKVMITRSPGTTAVGLTYNKWYRSQAKKDLKEDLFNGNITQEKYDDLIKANKKDLFHKYFKDKDFLARQKKISEFNPDITLIIHYNASEFENVSGSMAPEVQDNYSVAFVPGGFTKLELNLESQLEDFIRLASSDLIYNSVQLSSFIVNEFEYKLGAKRLTPNDNPDLWYLKKYSVYTGNPGVFSRNLFMTRAIDSPVCYGEATLQNNKDEIKRLAKRDFEIGPYKTTSRVIDVADCYFNGSIKFFESLGWIK